MNLGCGHRCCSRPGLTVATGSSSSLACPSKGPSMPHRRPAKQPSISSKSKFSRTVIDHVHVENAAHHSPSPQPSLLATTGTGNDASLPRLIRPFIALGNNTTPLFPPSFKQTNGQRQQTGNGDKQATATDRQRRRTGNGDGQATATDTGQATAMNRQQRRTGNSNRQATAMDTGQATATNRQWWRTGHSNEQTMAMNRPRRRIGHGDKQATATDRPQRQTGHGDKQVLATNRPQR